MPDSSSRPGQKTAMISSTSLDLPEHRQQAIDACLRQSVFPIAMEQLPASDADAIRVSMEMVEKADIYIGVFAWRYGHVPEGQDISITEMEFNRAVERKIPILVFTIHKDHALTIEMVEADKGAQEKLKKLKDRACEGRGRLEFSSPVELRSHIIQSLADLLPKMDEAAGTTKTINFHPPNLIPTAPDAYIAHPYSLLQTSEVVGRRDELRLLTDWVTANKEIPPGIRLFNVVAIGGMGKSALTWKWFNDIAPNELPHLAGRMWWSFYESDAYFENFIIRALAYTAGMTEAAVRELQPHEREDQLFHLLDQQPFLLVLDGLERILLAYSRMDAAHMDTLGTRAPSPAGVATDEVEGKEQASGTMGSSAETASEGARVPSEEHRIRQCADPRDGRFLRRLAQVRASRILISTRLYPAELETITTQPLPGCHKIELTGLSDDDALTLWRAFIGGERSGTSEQLLPLFNAFGNYPLLVRALAGRVASYRAAPGDFDRWHRDHPGFNPATELDLCNDKTHVLHYALQGLGDAQQQVLHTIAAFRMPATWDTLRAVLTGKGKPCRDDRALDDVLTELEDRGLVGWDRRANRYDLHPLVRGIVWSALGSELRRGVYTSLHAHFAAVPEMREDEISRLEDLTPAIELYNTLIGLGRYEDALDLYQQRLFSPLQFKLSLTNKQVEFLKMLFPDGSQNEPKLPHDSSAAHALRYLAESYHRNGQPGLAVKFYTRCINHDRAWIEAKSLLNQPLSFGTYLVSHLQMLSDALQLSGTIYQACLIAFQTLIVSRAGHDDWHEAIILSRIGSHYVIRGNVEEGRRALYRSLLMFSKMPFPPREGGLNFLIAQLNVWLDNPAYAKTLAGRAWELAQYHNFERDFIRAARVQGAAALGLHDFTSADERLHHALIRARQVNYVEEELPALIALAELRRRQGQPDEAREYLDAVWDSAARGPYPLFHADALNVLAALERDLGHREEAIAAATESYKKAWCDGPPYAYHWGLEAARKHLQELGAPEPEMPLFDPSKFDPMPDVEINPKDEFYVEIGEANAEE